MHFILFVLIGLIAGALAGRVPSPPIYPLSSQPSLNW
jgi:hypothetical protein